MDQPRTLSRTDTAAAPPNLLPLRAAVRAYPAHPAAHAALANALLAQGLNDEALHSYDRALRLAPRDPGLHNNRGTALRALMRLDDALQAIDRALALKPDYARAHNNRGNVLRDLGRAPEALAAYQAAVHHQPDHALAWLNLGRALQNQQGHEQAAACFERAWQLAPQMPEVLGALLHARQNCADWRDLDLLQTRLRDALARGERAAQPFACLAALDDPATELRCARLHAQSWPQQQAPALWRPRGITPRRLRIAYLSADFHAHATAHLMAGLIEHHDRSRFEVRAVSFGPRDDDPQRQRLQRAFEHFDEVGHLSDLAVAEQLAAQEIDIAIDLKGYTGHSRPGILAYRPAPVQVSWLGYPGTMGAPWIDYLVADPQVLPPERHRHYSEQVITLPESYQVNDRERRIAPHTPSRAELGLPAEGLVYCCFNNIYKLTPTVFAVWLRLLHATPGSVLWLLQGNDAATRHLRGAAQQQGIDPDRLVFAPWLPHAEHLARYRAADLFLDTLPVNAHTTASDALWAGLPVLTCRGRSFASRVGASLLHALHLPELVAHDLAAYEARALQLAHTPHALGHLRARLAAHRQATPLFDTARFCRHLETAFERVWQTHVEGRAPAPLHIPALP